MSPIIRIMFGPGIAYRHGEDVREVLIRDPAMQDDDKRTYIGQHGRKAAEADRGNDGEMQRQRQKT